MRNISYKIQKKLCDESDGLCNICKKPIALDDFKKYVAWRMKYKNGIKSDIDRPRRVKIDVTVDHIYPVSKGGTNEFTNLALAHKRCNELKTNKIV